MTRYLAIINPQAKSGANKQLIDDYHSLFAGLNMHYVETTAPGHARQVAAEATDVDVVVALGGDGTVHEVVNGLMEIPAESRPRLGIIPCGSGNDAARMAGIPMDISDAVRVLVEDYSELFDVGQCNDTYFINSCSVGLDALVVAKTIEYKRKSRASGTILYWAALLHVITHSLRAIELMLSYNDEPPVAKRVIIAAVTNGKTYGSGIKINPSASPVDNTLTAATIDWMTLAQIFRALPLLAAGTHPQLAQYQVTEIRKLSIHSSTQHPLVAQADGEMFSAIDFEIACLPHAVRVVCPARPTDDAGA